jgi:hypothetical protein
MATMLSPHFSLEELTFSDTAVRLGIDNRPPPEVIERLKIAAAGMEQIRTELGALPIKINSGYRCEKLERVLTQADFKRWCAAHAHPVDSPESWTQYFNTKAHPKGYAVDWTCAQRGEPVAIVRFLAAKSFRCDQIIQEGTWIHTSFDPQCRMEVLTASFDASGTPTYTRGA